MSDDEVRVPHDRPYIEQTSLVTSLHFSGHETQSQMWNHAPHALALDYTQTMMGFLLFLPKPQSIAMIGLGGGSLAKFCYRHLKQTRIDVVEINPQVLSMRGTFRIPADNERFQAHLGDGADYVRQARQAFDVLLVDGYDSNGMPARLCSADFYRRCKRALTANGVMVANITCEHPSYKRVITSIRSAFGANVLVIGDKDCTNDVVIAWMGELDDSLLSDCGRSRLIHSDTWDDLDPALERVRFAWRERARVAALKG